MRPIIIPQITAVETLTAVADAVFTYVSGNAVNIASAGGNLPTLAVGDSVVLDSAADAENNGVFTLTDLVTVNEEYIFSKRELPRPVTAVSEAINMTEARGMVKLEAENPSLHIIGNVGNFTFTVEYSLDGVVWYDSGITAITQAGAVLTVLTGKIVWARINPSVLTTSLDIGYVV